MFSKFILVSLCSFGLLFSTATASELERRSIPQGLYHSCYGGGLSEVCRGAIEEAWANGKSRIVTSEHQFWTSSDGKCKVTFWSDGGYIPMQNVDQFKAAVLQVNDLCQQSGLTSVVSPYAYVPGYKNVFVGRLSGNYMVVMLDAYPGHPR
ncbi:hypothetical protein CROQUDRAFT_572460 [Cronartium quercuum f. sp. fusiforme G11]|uniref:Uncharacterized protein n=1 Tax=Cronartium quercuum f. sp. fusiforme G11 TaxID=708437 RepID=A0A9P6NSK7_9BASI|nr:hypothetical protein CROQUDRAFT_572460 [Cronartium quercuum f. sp. fusiforme G11]